MDSSKKRVTLSGYYGFNNAGDEAVLAGLIQAIRAQPGGSEVDINALSIDPLETSRSHSVSSAHRYRVGPLLRSLARTDLLISGGGSLLQDVTSAHGIFYYIAVVRIAQMLGKKTMFAAQGIGPLNLARSRRLVAGVANRLDWITVRDADSLALLQTIGVTKPPMEVTADPALLLPAFPPLTHPSLLLPGKEREPRVAVSLRPWADSGQSLPETLAQAFTVLPAGAQATTVAMQPHSDEPMLEQFRAAWQKLKGNGTSAASDTGVAAVIETLSASDLVIGMRLHALILAAGSCVPSVALSYDPKVTAFMQTTGQEDAVVNMENVDGLSSVIARVWHTRRERSARLQERLPSLRAAALRTGEIAVRLLVPHSGGA